MNESSCACPAHDAVRCYRVRYGLDLREMMGDELDSVEAEEECCCSCHDEDEPESIPDHVLAASGGGYL